MAKTLLITFGCSWTFGVAAGYQPQMSERELRDIAWDADICYQNSWRGKLCQRFDMENRNFSSGGSSNQRQLRLAINYFNSDAFKRDREEFSDIKVLWGITSTARNEIWSLEDNQYRNFFYNFYNDFSRFFVLNSYSHDAEVAALCEQILHWNTFFQNLNIDNHWFDAFNTHDYVTGSGIQGGSNYLSWDKFKNHYESVAGPDWPSWKKYLNDDWTDVAPDIKQEIKEMRLHVSHELGFRFTDQQETMLLPRFIGHRTQPCDLMSWLCLKNHIEVDQDRKYHLSTWKIDDPRVSGLVDHGLLNPFSHHPTRAAHDMIADFLTQGANFG